MSQQSRSGRPGYRECDDSRICIRRPGGALSDLNRTGGRTPRGVGRRRFAVHPRRTRPPEGPMTETDTAPRLPAMRPDFSELVERARHGDADGLAAKSSRASRGSCGARVGGFGLSAEDRKDVFAAAFFRLFERIDTIREPHKLPGWMATTTRNEALDPRPGPAAPRAPRLAGRSRAEVGPLDQGLLDVELVDAAAPGARPPGPGLSPSAGAADRGTAPEPTTRSPRSSTCPGAASARRASAASSACAPAPS